jgi:F0F1-type ATP synthase assembly protein I
MPGRGPFQKLARGFAVASTLGTGFAGTVALATWLGYRCDRALGWRPIACTLLFGLVGGAAGMLFVVRTLAAFDREETDAGDDSKKDGRPKR